jgi:hypothetical protein
MPHIWGLRVSGIPDCPNSRGPKCPFLSEIIQCHIKEGGPSKGNSPCVGPESGVFMFLSVNSISTCTENTRGSKTSDIESNITDLSFEVLNKHHSLIHVTG